MMRWPIYTLILLIMLVYAPVARATLSIDVSSPVIKVSTGFTGASVTVFGTQDQEGALVITLKGPQKDFTLRKKNKVFGLWTNTNRKTFTNIPSYYFLASSAPLTQVTTPEILYTNGLGVDKILGTNTDEFSQSLIRIQQEQHLFGRDDQQITYISPILYKTTFDLPATVIPGTYTASAFLFRNGILTEQANTAFEVVPDGLSAQIRTFATQHSLLYGLASILIALIAGWLANALLKRE
jgi:uncharacterized protein (TIGR02186 family)